MRARRNLATEGRRFEIEDLALAADHIAVEIDLDVEAETLGGGAQFGEGAAMFDAHGLENLDEAARGGEMANADAVDRLDEGRGRTIHDRHFRPIDLDQAIIDAEAAQGGDQMLDGADHVLRAVADDGAKLGHGDFGPVRLDAPAAAIGQAAAQEHQAGMGFGGIENETDRLAGMNANASGERRRGPGEWSESSASFAFRRLVPLEWRDRCGYPWFRHDLRVAPRGAWRAARRISVSEGSRASNRAESLDSPYREGNFYGATNQITLSYAAVTN